MFLLSKILSKFTPKLNKLHLTTITLFKANFTGAVDNVADSRSL